MPRLAILTTDEIKAFDKPQKLTKVQREKYFHINEKLGVLLKTLGDSTYKLCITLQWGYFRASGRFFLIKDFHLGDVKYVCDKLNIPYHFTYLNSLKSQHKVSYFIHLNATIAAPNELTERKSVPPLLQSS